MSFLELISRFGSRRPRVLFVDDAPPSASAGAGQPRAALIVDSLLQAGATVTILARFGVRDFNSADKGRARCVIQRPRDERHFDELLASEISRSDFVIVSRPNNMVRCQAILDTRDRRKVRLIYDAEAIFAKRQRLQRELQGSRELGKDDLDYDEELALARKADVILSVSEAEAEAFRKAGHPDVRVLSYASPYLPADAGFGDRAGFLFVGPVYHPTTPNADSLIFFTEQVFPLIRAALPGVRLVTAGHAHEDVPARFSGVTKLGAVPDLAAIYGRCRVFIAPTRFAAGIPLKAIDAAAGGVPIVMTSLLAQQLDWQNGREALVEDDAKGFAEACIRLYSDEAYWQDIRKAALARVMQDFSRPRFDRSVRRLILPQP